MTFSKQPLHQMTSGKCSCLLSMKIYHRWQHGTFMQGDGKVSKCCQSKWVGTPKRLRLASSPALEVNQREKTQSLTGLWFHWSPFNVFLSHFRSLPPGRKALCRQAYVFLYQVSTVCQLHRQDTCPKAAFTTTHVVFVDFSGRGQSNEAPATEGHHYCVDENTERRNHYLDLAGIENYTSRFEGKHFDITADVL